MRCKTGALAVVSILLLTGGAAEDSTGRAERRVYDKPEAVEPLTPGSAVPEATLEDLDGMPVDLAGLVREDGALLVFYRGGW